MEYVQYVTNFILLVLICLYYITYSNQFTVENILQICIDAEIEKILQVAFDKYIDP